MTFDIEPGELVVLLGSSGSGKTTLLRMINRLVEPTSGSIFVNGEDVQSIPAPQLRRQIGYVIQQAGLFPHMRVRDNVAVVPRLLKWSREQTSDRVNTLLDLVGLPTADYADRYPAQLSGGEQQRVGLARALAAEPATLLMDEPFGALDAITRRRLQDELLRIHKDLACTIIFVTHDVDEAIRLADRIAVMRYGKVLQIGRPLELMTNPANDFVADLIGADDAFRQLRLLDIGTLVDASETSTLDVSLPTIGEHDTAHDALNRLMLTGAPALRVESDTGNTLGTVTVDSIRASIATPTSPEASATAAG